VTKDSVVRDEMIVPDEEPSKMDQLLAMLMQSNLDAKQDAKLLREELREQREQSKYDIDRLYRSTSNLEERMNGVLEDLEKREDQETLPNTSPNGQIVLDGDDDAETSTEKVFLKEPALKASPIDQVSDQSREEGNFFLDSANYGFQKRAPLKKRFGFNSERDASRRESKVISDMMYNIQRSEAQSVYKMVTAEPFTKKLSKLDITHFLWWFTNWNDHMILTRTYTEPTNLVSAHIREMLCENNEISLEEFHALEPDDFIYLISKELKIYSMAEFHEKMTESYGAMAKISFHAGQGIAAQAEFYTGMLAGKNYFRKCLELLSIHSSKFAPPMKGDHGLVKIFTSTLELSYVKSMQWEMREVGEYKSITDYILAFCDVAKVHLEEAKVYARQPNAFNKKSSGASPSPNPTGSVRFEKKAVSKDPDFNRGGYKPKETWKDRQSPYPRKSDLGNIEDLAEVAIGYADEDPEDETDEAGADPALEDVSHVDEDFEAMLAECCIPCDRNEATRALFMAGSDGEVRPRGCLYYTIFGSCLKGATCINADGHNSRGRASCAAWLMQKLNDKSPTPYGQGNMPKILPRPQGGPK
jgi:hypothetical protein